MTSQSLSYQKIGLVGSKSNNLPEMLNLTLSDDLFDFEESEQFFTVKKDRCCETAATWVYYYALVAWCFPISLYRKYQLAVALRYKAEIGNSYLYKICFQDYNLETGSKIYGNFGTTDVCNGSGI